MTLINSPLEELEEPLKALSEIYPTVKHSLGQVIQEKAKKLNLKISRVNTQIKTSCDSIDSTIDKFNQVSDKVQEKLNTSKSSTETVLGISRQLKKKRDECSKEIDMISLFSRSFTLSREEVDILTDDPKMDKTFFTVLEKLSRVNYNTRTILMEVNLILGQECLDILSHVHDAAFSKVYSWTQNQILSIRVDSPEIPKGLVEGIKALRSRPVLFQSILDEIVLLRKNVVQRAFIEALTEGGPGGIPRPIDMYAHDPLRYIGDILAWVHQSSASEKEMIESLFGNSTLNVDKQEILKDVPEFDLEQMSVINLLHRHFEGICRPLKARIDHLLESQSSPILLYRIANLIQFYGQTISKISGEKAPISLQIEELSNISFKIFFDRLNAQAWQLLTVADLPGKDLSPIPAHRSSLEQLRDVLLSHETSLSLSNQPILDSSKIVLAVLDPLKQSFNIIAEKINISLEKSIFLVNAYTLVLKNTLSMFSFTMEHTEDIQELLDMQTETLVEEQYTNILKQSGLAALVQNVEINKKADIPLSQDDKTNATMVMRSMTFLDTFLSSISSDISLHLSRITSPKLLKTVMTRGFIRFLEVYKKLSTDLIEAYGSSIKLLSPQEVSVMPSQTKEASIECIFDPPLWIQRRAFAVNFLLENAVESVFDFGCGDGSLIQVLINNCKFLKLAGIDIDLGEVYAAVDNCSPKAQDYEDKRELPLNIQFYQGSIDAMDDRCKYWDAITMIEVIEHLPADVLKEFPKLLFGVYKPKFVIISTPNAEFNVNFPNLNYGSPDATLRHWDHQFEWTRTEFQSWSLDVANLYDYTVSFDTVGYFVSKQESKVGGCSQFAIFQRSNHAPEISIMESKMNFSHKLISTIDYPYFEEVDFSDDQIVDSIISHCREIFRKEALWKPDISAHGFQIYLKEIWDILEIRQKCKTFDKLQSVINGKSGVQVFNLLGGNKIQCGVFMSDLKDEIEKVDEQASFDLLCINSTDSVLEGWGQSKPDDHIVSNMSGW